MQVGFIYLDGRSGIICKTASEKFRGRSTETECVIPSTPKYTQWWIPKINGCIRSIKTAGTFRVQASKPKTAQMLISWRMGESHGIINQ